MLRYALVAATVAALPAVLVLARVGPGPLAGGAAPEEAAAPAPAAPAPVAEEEVVVMNFPVEPLDDPPAGAGRRAAPPAPCPQVRRPAPPRLASPPARPPVHEVVDPDGDGLVGAVNLNTASPQELVLLPGMGPKRARALVGYRDRRRLTHARQVQRIRGVGPKSFRRWRPHIKVHGDSTLRRVVRPQPGRPGTAPRRPPS